MNDVVAMADFLMDQLTSLGIKAEKRSIGTHTFDGKEMDLPPVIIGQLGDDPKKASFARYLPVPPLSFHQKTLAVYGHYDVQPALMSDGWIHPPFELTRDPKGTGKLYGRGSTDDKGPVMGWLNVIEAHKKLGLELPVRLSTERSTSALRFNDDVRLTGCNQVNLKMCFEGMEENGSVNLDKFIESEKGKFFSGIDCMCISGVYLGQTRIYTKATKTITGSIPKLHA